MQLQFLEIDCLAGEAELVGRRRRRLIRGLQPVFAPQQAADAGDQNIQVERLGQIIVRAGLKSFQYVLRASARRKHQDRSKILPLAKLGGHRESVFAGQHHVQQHQVKRLRSSPACRSNASSPSPAISTEWPSASKVEAQALCNVRLVFHHQDAAHT